MRKELINKVISTENAIIISDQINESLLSTYRTALLLMLFGDIKSDYVITVIFIFH